MVLIRARISLMHDLYMAWVKGMKSFSLGGWKRPLSNLSSLKFQNFQVSVLLCVKWGHSIMVICDSLEQDSAALVLTDMPYQAYCFFAKAVLFVN